VTLATGVGLVGWESLPHAAHVAATSTDTATVMDFDWVKTASS